MRRQILFGLLCGVLVLGGLYALNEVVYLPKLLRSSPQSNVPVTQFGHFELTADGKPICPRCGRSGHVRTYQYGLTREAPPMGVINGGCAVGSDSPEYKCLRCGTNFGKSSFYKQLNEPNKAAEEDELKKQEKKP